MNESDTRLKLIDPVIKKKWSLKRMTVADFACGTGGFLTSALKLLAPQVKTPADQELYSQSIYGIEKRQLPYLLCMTNMLLHGIDSRQVFHDNSLDHDIREYRHKEGGQFNVVLMNPPYGGSEKATIQGNELPNGPKAKHYSVDELIASGFNFDLCGYPHEEEVILPPDELIRNYRVERAKIDAEIDAKLAQICKILGIEVE